MHVIKKVDRPRPARCATGPTKQDTTQALGEDIDRDVSYALQQVVQHGTGTNAQALGRPAAGKTGTATNDDGPRLLVVVRRATPRSSSTAVMYVRGDGNDQLDDGCAAPVRPYFGADYPTETWTA